MFSRATAALPERHLACRCTHRVKPFHDLKRTHPPRRFCSIRLIRCHAFSRSVARPPPRSWALAGRDTRRKPLLVPTASTDPHHPRRLLPGRQSEPVFGRNSLWPVGVATEPAAQLGDIGLGHDGFLRRDSMKYLFPFDCQILLKTVCQPDDTPASTHEITARPSRSAGIGPTKRLREAIALAGARHLSVAWCRVGEQNVVFHRSVVVRTDLEPAVTERTCLIDRHGASALDSAFSPTESSVSVPFVAGASASSGSRGGSTDEETRRFPPSNPLPFALGR